MPALPPVPNVLRCDLIHAWSGDTDLGNRTFFRYSGGAPSEANLNTLAGDTAAEWGVFLAPLANEAVALKEVVWTDLTSDTAARGTWTGTQAGTRAGTRLTVGVAALLNFQISRRYRGGKPRTYNPWGVEGDLVTDQTWSNTFITACDTAWTNYVSALQGLSVGTLVIGAQVNVSYYSGFASVQNPVTKRWRNIPTPRDTAVDDDIDSHSLNPIVGSQRRRYRAA